MSEPMKCEVCPYFEDSSPQPYCHGYEGYFDTKHPECDYVCLLGQTRLGHTTIVTRDTVTVENMVLTRAEIEDIFNKMKQLGEQTMLEFNKLAELFKGVPEAVWDLRPTIYRDSLRSTNPLLVSICDPTIYNNERWADWGYIPFKIGHVTFYADVKDSETFLQLVSGLEQGDCAEVSIDLAELRAESLALFRDIDIAGAFCAYYNNTFASFGDVTVSNPIHYNNDLWKSAGYIPFEVNGQTYWRTNND